MRKVLIDGATATNAVKQIFGLNDDDFIAIPTIRAVGLGAGDVVTVWVQVAGIWIETGDVLNNTTPEVLLASMGTYAVSIVMTLSGPAYVEVETSGQIT
jgi:hypothetical protein